MNEHLKELAFRSGFVGESMFPIFGTVQQTALQNFADLIIKECISINRERMQKPYEGDEPGTAHIGALYRANQDINKHFYY